MALAVLAEPALGLFAMYSCNRGLRMLPPRGGGVRLDIMGSLLLASTIVSCLLALSWGGSSLMAGSRRKSWDC